MKGTTLIDTTTQNGWCGGPSLAIAERFYLGIGKILNSSHQQPNKMDQSCDRQPPVLPNQLYTHCYTHISNRWVRSFIFHWGILSHGVTSGLLQDHRLTRVTKLCVWSKWYVGVSVISTCQCSHGIIHMYHCMVIKWPSFILLRWYHRRIQQKNLNMINVQNYHYQFHALCWCDGDLIVKFNVIAPGP